MDRTIEPAFEKPTLPTERDERGWLGAVMATAAGLLRAPGRSFIVVPESIRHARVLGFIATMRLPLWGALILWMMVRAFTRTEPEAWQPTALGQVLDVALVDALSLWLLLLVPLGFPLLYFVAGLLAHVSLGLTGGARQSIGASMRAFGYTAAPALFVISVLDLLLYSGFFGNAARSGFSGPEIYAVILGGAVAVHSVFFAVALARTHRATMVRAILTAVLPVIFFGGVTMGRALLHLERFPFVAAPEPSPYAPILIK